jgi:hypothetical protein
VRQLYTCVYEQYQYFFKERKIWAFSQGYAMEIDKWEGAQWLQVFTAVTTAVFAASTLWLAVKQHFVNKRGLLREEYKFAKGFFEDVVQSPAMHRFPRIKGYQAIAGIHTLPPAIIQHLMDFPDPVVALSDYAFSRGYLKDTPSLKRRRLDFERSLFSTEARQLFWSRAFTFIAIFSYSCAFAPLFFGTMQQISLQLAALFSILTVPLGLFLSVTFTREAFQLRHAARLVKTQNDLALSYELVDDRDDDERD